MKALIYIFTSTAILGLAFILLISVLYAWDKLTFVSFRNLLVVCSLVWFAGILLAGQIRKRKCSIHSSSR
ncbi:MAG: hypothetical protein R6W31_14135 [Bacteroidales bacterium]